MLEMRLQLWYFWSLERQHDDAGIHDFVVPIIVIIILIITTIIIMIISYKE